MKDDNLTIMDGDGKVADDKSTQTMNIDARKQRLTLFPSAKKRLYSECEWIFGGKVEKERCGAYGVFTVTNNLTRYTKASLFSRTGKKTHVFLTFSEAARCKGNENIGRHICVYSIKFHTEDGIWDLIGCNHPVSFTCHPQKYHDCICSSRELAKNDPAHLADKWDMWAHLPDSLHQVMFLMGDRGIPRDYRHMHGFGCRTYSFINKENQRFWIKFHLLTQQGILNLTRREALEREAGINKFAQRDLHDNIKRGNYPRWKMYIQCMPEEDAEKCTFNPLDPTKVWPHVNYPLIEAGTLELLHNPAQDSMEVRYTNFSPFNLVAGIEIPKYSWFYGGKSDYYVQPGVFFRLQGKEAQQRLIHNIVSELVQVPELIQIRAAARFYQADKYCGKEIANKLHIEIKLILEEIEWQKEEDVKMTY